MRQNRESIINTNLRVGRLFKTAYFCLKEAKTIQEEWESYITEATNFAQVNEVTTAITEEIFTGVTPNFRTEAKPRHLFATAITPDGPVNYLDTILQDTEILYVIKGEPGCGKTTLAGKIAGQAQNLGLYTEVYHCAFVPQNVDIVVIPQLSTAVANLSAPISFDPECLGSLKSCKEINLSLFFNPTIISVYSDEISSCRDRFNAAFNRAVDYLSLAKAEHDLMESFYVPAMDFTAINARKEDLLARIIKYAEEN
ncbi:MAG: hypothetical protein ACYC21_08665 [Eubacteriales bacterium]